jgi:hypothetical protein
VRRRHPLAAAALLVLVLGGCGGAQRLEQSAARRQVALQRQAQERQRCRRHWQQLEPRLARFQEQRERLATLEAEAYLPGPGRPPALDPEEQRRLALYDQEIEQEHYQQALEAWREQEHRRRARWAERQAVRMEQARDALEAAASALRSLEPDLLDTAAPPGLNAALLTRLQRCDQGA